MTSKYRSLEHIILRMMAEGQGSAGDKFKGNPPGFMDTRNNNLQSQSKTLKLEDGPDTFVVNRTRKISYPLKPTIKADKPSQNMTAKPASIPNRADNSDSNVEMQSNRESGGKKLKESTNDDLIKKNLLTKNALTQYTNPQNKPQGGGGEAKPALSFTTPDLSGDKKDDQDIQTPNVKKAGEQKKTSDSVTKKDMPTPANNKQLAKAEKISDKITKNMPNAAGSGATMAPGGMSIPGLPNVPAVPFGGPIAGALAGLLGGMYGAQGVDAVRKSDAWNKNPDAGKGVVPGGPGSPQAIDPSGLGNKPIDKYTNPDIPGGLSPDKFNNQQQATPPNSPGNGTTGNSPKGGKAPTLENPSAPSPGSAPIDVVGKKPGEQAKFTSASDKTSGSAAVGIAPAYDALPHTNASKTVPAMRNPPLPTVSLPPAASTALPKVADKDKGGAAPAMPKIGAVNPSNLPVPYKGAGLPVPSSTPGSVPDSKGADTKAPSVPEQGADTKKPDVAQAKPDQATADDIKKQLDKSESDVNKGVDKRAQEKEQEKEKADKDKQDKENKENKDKKGTNWWKYGALGGLGLGGLALLNFLRNNLSHDGSGGGGTGGNRGHFVYGSPGQLSGTPVRKKGGDLSSMLGGMKEETGNLDKVRRAMAYVGRRDGDNKKKPTLGRQAAVKTDVVDEGRSISIVREAIKEKQDKNKKIEPGKHKTPVDLTPTLKPEPRDNFKQ